MLLEKIQMGWRGPTSSERTNALFLITVWSETSGTIMENSAAITDKSGKTQAWAGGGHTLGTSAKLLSFEVLFCFF